MGVSFENSFSADDDPETLNFLLRSLVFPVVVALLPLRDFVPGRPPSCSKTDEGVLLRELVLECVSEVPLERLCFSPILCC